MEPLSPNGPLKVAITVDDLFQWQGIPFPDGYSAQSVSRSLIEAFERNAVPEVYAFSSTGAVEDDPTLLSVLDTWCAAGHHVGGHTHYHASLNWVSPEVYLEDIERGNALVQEWIDAAPARYFRPAYGMRGDTREKEDALDAYLVRAGYREAPMTFWFYDAQFIFPYWRTVVAKDDEARRWVQDQFVETAVDQLRRQAAAARAAIGRDPVHISLVHGTAVAGDTYDRVLEAFAAHGVEFVTLDEAMTDPYNTTAPPGIERMFRNTTQRWAAFHGVEIPGVPPANLPELRATTPIDGLGEDEVIGAAIMGFAEKVGAVPTPDDFDW